MENEQQFKSNWRSAAKKVEETTVQEEVKRKARQFGFLKADNEADLYGKVFAQLRQRLPVTRLSDDKKNRVIYYSQNDVCICILYLLLDDY